MPASELTFQHICALTSVFTNFLLMLLILTKSPSQLGTYKWLMLYTCLFELAYSSLDIFVEPTIRSFQSVSYVLQRLRRSLFGHDATFFFLSYGFCRFFKQNYIRGAKQSLLFVAPVVTGVAWGLLSWLTLNETPSKSEFLKTHFQQLYNMKIEECAYVAFHFWPVDAHGVTHPDAISFLCVAVMFLILGSSFASVIYFGIKCYQYISIQLGNVSSQSQATKTLQVQLFYSLIFQTAIPCIFMYLPTSAMFIIPMLDLGYDIRFPLLSMTIAIYPAIDPLPTIFIIKSYRRGLTDVFRCRKRNHVAASNS
ncbi:Seven TM Receptor [Caenorhabditis elegans]|uniref:Seven TM Receptor n=1 Tax=Caenorhabditis elegans TaxID=6239 RepID=Q9XUR8_CAEEL|nr:Seven TM Receptor [Caenorhabditis elegans]CAB04642.1 Seven TM Receptor [Caenorhabditis elegans]|eukprot:NP_507571.1 Uncharacterized protein CELE_R10E8.5 [Caenorhabditis elegans]